MHVNQETHPQHEPWNAGRVGGAKPPLKPKHIWALRTRLQIANRVHDLAMLNLAIGGKLRGCDLVTLKVGDVFSGSGIRTRSVIVQHKTGQIIHRRLLSSARSGCDARSPFRFRADGRSRTTRAPSPSRP